MIEFAVSSACTESPTDVGIVDHALAHQQMIDRLADLWQGHEKRGLTVRWEMGKLLNKSLGPPTERHPYGRQVLKRAAQQLGISLCDLSRMRSFAAGCESLDDWHLHHPEAHSWTHVKKVLPTLSDARKGKKKSRRRREERAEIHSILRPVSKMTRRLRQRKLTLDELSRDLMCHVLLDLVTTANEQFELGIKLVFEKTAEAVCPVSPESPAA